MHDLSFEERRLPIGIAAGAAAILLLLASASDVRASDLDMQPEAMVIIDSGHGALLGESGRDGTLFFHGRGLKFSLRGLAIGSIGADQGAARGRVYNLRGASFFPGDYARFGVHDAGQLWLRNRDGVVLELEPASDQVAIAMRPDTVTISYR